MENLPDALNALPRFAPGLIIGAIVGVVYGLYADHKADDVPHRWWQYGGLGIVLGGIAWWALLELS